jgi:hypothetical protein
LVHVLVGLLTFSRSGGTGGGQVILIRKYLGKNEEQLEWKGEWKGEGKDGGGRRVEGIVKGEGKGRKGRG